MKGWFKMDILKFQDATIAIELLVGEGYQLDDVLMMCRWDNVHHGEVDINRVREGLNNLKAK